MGVTIDEVTLHIHKAVKDLCEAHPDSGFIVISVTGSERDAVVSMACNIDDELAQETLTYIIEGNLEDDDLTWQ